VNGTYVNGLRIHRYHVKENDEIQFGGMCDIPEGYLLQQSDVSVKYTFHFLNRNIPLPATEEPEPGHLRKEKKKEKQANSDVNSNEIKKKKIELPQLLTEEEKVKTQQNGFSSSLRSLSNSDKEGPGLSSKKSRNDSSVSSSSSLHQKPSYPQLQLREKQAHQRQQNQESSKEEKEQTTTLSSSSSHKRSLSLTVISKETTTTTNISGPSFPSVMISEEQGNIDIDRLSIQNEGNPQSFEGESLKSQSSFPSPAFRSSLLLPSAEEEERVRPDTLLTSSNHQKTKRAKLDNNQWINVGIERGENRGGQIMNEKMNEKEEVEMIIDSTMNDPSHFASVTSTGELTKMKEELHSLKSFQEKELNEIKQQLQLLLSSSALSFIPSDDTTSSPQQRTDRMIGRRKNDKATLETVTNVDNSCDQDEDDEEEGGLVRKRDDHTYTVKTLNVESEEEEGQIISKLLKENQKLKCLYYIVKLQQKREGQTEEEGEGKGKGKGTESLLSLSFSAPNSVTRNKINSRNIVPLVSCAVPDGIQSVSTSSSTSTVPPPSSSRSALPVPSSSQCSIDLQSLFLQLTCPLCSSLLLDAAVLRCSHGFCRLCIERYLHRETCDSTCPICKDPPPPDALPSDGTGKQQAVYYRSDQLDNLVWIVLQASSEAEVLVRLYQCLLSQCLFSSLFVLHWGVFSL
jgi:hypothetical protein